MLSPKRVIIGITPKLGNRNHACDERLLPLAWVVQAGEDGRAGCRWWENPEKAGVFSRKMGYPENGSSLTQRHREQIEISGIKQK